MTLKELSQIYYLRKEKDHLRNKIEKLRSEAENTTQTFPGLPGSGKISDKVCGGVTSIVYLQDKLEKAEQRITEEVIKLEEYLDSISDSFIRQIFRLRFEDCRKWEDIADLLHATSYSVKHICYRYLKRNEKLAHMAQSDMVE